MLLLEYCRIVPRLTLSQLQRNCLAQASSIPMSRKDSHGQGLRLLAPGPSDGLPTYKDATTDPDYQDAVKNLCNSLDMMKTKYPNTTFGKVTKDNLTTSFAQGLARLKNSSKHTQNIETAHIAFNRTLRCIGAVGGAAAKGASNVSEHGI